MPSPRHRRANAARSWSQRVALAVGMLLTVGCVAAATGVGYVYWKTGRFERADVTLDERKSKNDPINYLLIGSDSRDDIDPNAPNADVLLGESTTGKRSDTIIVVRVDPVTSEVNMLSFPRDLWVPIAGHGTAKINSAYSYGRQTLIDTIRQNFGIDINNYIEVDLIGFQKLVDAIGGVNLYFPAPARDEHSGLYVDDPGCVSMDGEAALAFARSRYYEVQGSNGRWQTDPLSDLGRIKRQQTFIRKAVDKTLSKGISNPLTFNSLLDVATSSVTLDKSIDRDDLRDLAAQFGSMDPEAIGSLPLKVRNAQSSDGQSILLIEEDDPETIATLNLFRGLPPGAVTEGQVTVDVRNGTGADKQASQVSLALAAVGFRQGPTGDTPTTATLLRYAPGSEAAVDLVARHLTSPAQLVPDASLKANQVVLVTGPDFTSVMQVARPATTTTTTTVAETPGQPVDTTPTTGATTSTTVDRYNVGVPPEGVAC